MLIFGASLKYTGKSELRMKKVRSRKDFTSKWQKKYEETIPLLSEDKPLQRTNFKIIIKKLTKALKSKKEGFLNFRRLLLI